MSEDDPLPLDLPQPFGPVVATAKISDDGLYRYTLSRRWDYGGTTAFFIMLNPSTADGFVDDPTIRRCMGYAKAWDCTALVVVNLYAYRATKPEDLWTVEDPVGPDNDYWLRREMAVAKATDAPLIAAWGANAKPDRVAHVRLMPGAGRMQALGLTKGGQPRHPLYLPATAKPTPIVGGVH